MEKIEEKLKSVLHRRKKSTPTQSPRASYEHPDQTSPRTEQHPASPLSSRQQKPTAPNDVSHPETRGQPRDSAYHDRRASHAVATPSTGSNGSNGSMADDYRSYLPALVSEEHSNVEPSVPDRHLRYRPSTDGERSKALPALPNTLHHPHGEVRRSIDVDGPGRTIRAVPTEAPTDKYAVGSHDINNGGLDDDVRSREQRSSSDKHGLSKSGQPVPGLTNNDALAVKPLPGLAITKDYQGTDGAHDWKEKQQAILAGVVNLNNTVDTDRDTTVAPAVTHEIIKPHEHEVIQQQIHREIHNYTYYHRLQPVLQTEVLPPRHFIPNPDGEGLIEISADELPNRTGKNRWWDIVQKEPNLPATPFEWRTEPQIIEGKPYMTEEGFERRETTIIYPPTLDDMSRYRGLVQPVHFDHKTGERWLGEVTTVEKLNRELGRQGDEDFMTMKDVTADLPKIASSPSVKRKPLGRDSL
ncbi:hypothetical protein J4E90_005983 [Alternaria incomplexa]|uniref:uncharacterized protein n=1 Tax=Alternaria incomplexa TaxID=1187928 RepID=UPI00221EE2D5|nr:uncharacterized protein J4E90_005983 [Alternaria incomplexa]XP_051299320.1 uncharacterized protein J4E86_008958 [Alternaria arbusti]KAI4912578.1 hypothetical protein J4E90_005983 [Alternaria incomplexa]KAI4946254.1 hypothetical protein J4E86_008958 [Alternaria arbusti]